MDKAAFLELLELVSPDPVFENQLRNPQHPVWIQLLVTLERLGKFGNSVAFEIVGKNTGIGVGTVGLYYKQVITAIHNLREKFAMSLTVNQRKLHGLIMQENYSMPGCIGVIDGTQV
ncbi:hypothetical protein HK100_008660, partial [Physocladia obscura]